MRCLKLRRNSQAADTARALEWLNPPKRRSQRQAHRRRTPVLARECAHHAPKAAAATRRQGIAPTRMGDGRAARGAGAWAPPESLRTSQFSAKGPALTGKE